MLFSKSSEKTISKVVNLNVLGSTEEESNAFLKGRIAELEEKLAQVQIYTYRSSKMLIPCCTSNQYDTLVGLSKQQYCYVEENSFESKEIRNGTKENETSG